jgi:hypothetical protein
MCEYEKGAVSSGISEAMRENRGHGSAFTLPCPIF